MRPASDMLLSEIIAETADPSLSMASGGFHTIDVTLSFMQLPPGARYLEIGCAAGWMALRVADRRRDVTVLGIDPQESAIDAARSTADDWGLGNAIFNTGDARELMFPSKGIHGVFAGNIPTFVPSSDRPAIMRECRRVVTDDGFVVAVPMYYPGELPPDDIVDAVEATIGTPVHRGSEQEWIDLYESHGLHLVRRAAKRFAHHSDTAVTRYVDRVMITRRIIRHKPERRAELRKRLLELHRLFEANNRYMGYSVLAFQSHARHVGEFLLTPAPE